MSPENTPLAVGIDLGTTYSCVAHIDEYGKAVVLKNFEGDSTTPSVVYFPPDSEEVVVGKEAKNSKALEPDRVVDFIKRSMGEPNREVIIDDNEYRPEEVSAYILKKLVKDAEVALGGPITHAVITCPAYFGINKRQSTAQAGIIAGLKGYSVEMEATGDDEAPNIIPEPTAAAFCYGFKNTGETEVVMVYDLGGGTFDVTLLEITDNAINPICVGGDHELGGKNWDDALTRHCLGVAEEEGADLAAIKSDAMAMANLAEKVEDAKRALTAKGKTKLGTPHVRVELTRKKFEELTQGELERTVSLCQDMLNDAKEKGYDKFDKILLVGGSTKMPQVRERLEREFPGVPVETNEPDEAVAKGAALFAQKLLIDKMITDELFKLIGKDAAGKDRVEVADENPDAVKKAEETVSEKLGIPTTEIQRIAEKKLGSISSKSFGIVVLKEENPSEREISNLVHKNSQLPATISRQFSTSIENQGAAELQIMENTSREQQVELDMGQEIGNSVLPLPPGLPQGSPIDVTFDLNSEGLLRYSGVDPQSGNQIEGEIKTAAVMDETGLLMATGRANKKTVT